MKRIIAVILTALLMLTASLPAVYADGAGVTASAAYDAALGAIVVSGTVDSQYSNIYLMLEVTNPNGDLVYADQMVLPHSDEELKPYSFEPVTLHVKNMTGNYSFTVTAEDIGASAPATYYFMGGDVQYNALSALKEAITAQSKTDLSEVITADEIDSVETKYYEKLGISKDNFEAMNDAGKDAVLTVMLTKTYTVPEDYTSDESLAIIASSIDSVRNDWRFANVIGDFHSITSVSQLSSWIDANFAPYALDDPETTGTDEALIYTYIKSALSEGRFASRVASRAKELKPYTLDEIADIIREQALLTIIETRHFSESSDVFDSFPKLFGINKTAFNSLTPAKQGEVYDEVKGNYSSYEAAGDAFNSLVSSKKASGDTSGSGSTGGTGGGKGGITVNPGASVTTPQAPSLVFPDMANAQWATEAVTYLKAKGIVSGDSYGNFNPNMPVTRAEFAKMAVVATGVALGAEASFNDVSPLDWFYTYVGAAANDGLIMGDSVGNFNPHDLITREDMAVIIYRAYKIYEDLGYSLDFADSALISDYAREAVAFLSAKGVVNGIGDGTFAPKNTATRAEAAQMIYNAIK